MFKASTYALIIGVIFVTSCNNKVGNVLQESPVVDQHQDQTVHRSLSRKSPNVDLNSSKDIQINPGNNSTAPRKIGEVDPKEQNR